MLEYFGGMLNLEKLGLDSLPISFYLLFLLGCQVIVVNSCFLLHPTYKD